MFIGKYYLGNCNNVMRELSSDIVDLTVTSPPYDNLRNYGSDFVSYSETDWTETFKQLFRITKPGGVVVWVVGDAVIDGSETGTSFRQALCAKDCGFNIHDTMIWEKPNFSNPSRNRYHQLFEYMFVFSKGKPKTFNPIKDKPNKYKTCVGRNTGRNPDGSFSQRRRNECGEYGMRGNVWKNNTVGQDLMCKTPPHPAMFPVGIVEDHVKSWSNENDIVLDPFMGSGTTGRVCKGLGRNFIGIELDKNYFEYAMNSIENLNAGLF